MTKYWCVNFEFPNNLRHGIKKNLWLMQYQYSDTCAPTYETQPRPFAGQYCLWYALL